MDNFESHSSPSTIDMTDLRRIFAEKLLVTNDMDQALKKACWIAYSTGVKAGEESYKRRMCAEAIEAHMIAERLNGAPITCKEKG